MILTTATTSNPDRTMDTDSPWTERLWLPILGPSAIAMARLAMSLDRPLADPHAWLGITAAHAKRTAQRLRRFGWATWEITEDAPVVSVLTTQLPPARHRLADLPEPLRSLAGAAPTPARSEA